MTGRGAWQPVLEGATRDRALEVASDIASWLADTPWPDATPGKRPFPELEAGDDPHLLSELEAASENQWAARRASLSAGAAGMAVFFTYAYLAGLGQRYAELAVSHMEEAQNALVDVPMVPSLMRGSIGIVWAMQHLTGPIFEEESDDGADDPFDAELVRHLSAGQRARRFDLWNGVTGIGVYALEKPLRRPGDACLRATVRHLQRSADADGHGVCWPQRLSTMTAREKARFPAGYANVGVAHGTPGVVAYLGRLWATGVDRDAVEPLLEGAVAWVDAQAGPDDPASFPSFTEPRGASPPSRNVWCYGAPGIAASLLVAARCTGNPHWRARGQDIAVAASRAEPTRPIGDACLCHGTGGLAHLHARMFHELGHEALREGAQRWVESTFALRRPGEGVAGFAYLGLDETGTPARLLTPGLIQGAAGTGLALLAAATDVEPAWDRILLASAGAEAPPTR